MYMYLYMTLAVMRYMHNTYTLQLITRQDALLEIDYQ